MTLWERFLKSGSPEDYIRYAQSSERGADDDDLERTYTERRGQGREQ
ncbi:MAG: hypothetical protein IJ806_03625 [Ruminococcus sp.]|nr:hypothetical protein [Ruminococcus sp.]